MMCTISPLNQAGITDGLPAATELAQMARTRAKPRAMADFRLMTFIEILLVEVSEAFSNGHVSSLARRSLPSASPRPNVARGQVLMNAYVSPPAARRPGQAGRR